MTTRPAVPIAPGAARPPAAAAARPVGKRPRCRPSFSSGEAVVERGQRLTLADYAAETGLMDGATAAGGRSYWPALFMLFATTGRRIIPNRRYGPKFCRAYYCLVTTAWKLANRSSR